MCVRAMDRKATRVCAGNETSTSRSSCSSSTALFETRTGTENKGRGDTVLRVLWSGKKKKSRKMRDGRTSETARKIESLCG